MHYHVIQKSYQNRGRWLTFWQVEVIEGDRKAVYCFGGRLGLRTARQEELKYSPKNSPADAARH